MNAHTEEPSLPRWRLVELEERLVYASRTLKKDAQNQGTSPMGMARSMHLESKAQGVELALSYLRELRR